MPPTDTTPLPKIVLEAMAHHRAGRLAEAEALYRRALARDPGQANVHVNLGVALEGQGREEAAAEAYRAAIGLEPHHTVALSNLGRVLLSLGQLDEALARQQAPAVAAPGSPRGTR